MPVDPGETSFNSLKKVGQFSPKLGGSQGMRDLIGCDPTFFRTPSQADSDKEASGDTPVSAKRRGADAKQQSGCQSPARRSLNAAFEEQGASGTTNSTSDTSGLHHKERVHKKGVAHDFNTKETCPYLREDVIPEDAAVCSPTKRGCLSPPAKFAGTGVTPKGSELDEAASLEHRFPPERVVESRRDWQALQSKQDLEKLALQVPILRKALTSQRSPGSPQSAQGLSPQTIAAVENPVHSLRQRAAPTKVEPNRQRWK